MYMLVTVIETTTERGRLIIRTQDTISPPRPSYFQSRQPAGRAGKA